MVADVLVAVGHHRAAAVPPFSANDVHLCRQERVRVPNNGPDVEVVVPVFDRDVKRMTAIVQVGNDRLVPPVAILIGDVAMVAGRKQRRIKARIIRPRLRMWANARPCNSLVLWHVHGRMIAGIMQIRPATAADLGQINDLYNHYIATSAATFDLEPKTLQWRQNWFERFGSGGRYRLLVADQDGVVQGYACSTQHRDKAAYDPSVETSVYVAHVAIGGGIGSQLYTALFKELSNEDVHRALAGITLPNDGSVALHQRFGFERAGVFTEQGRKFDRYWDVAWYERPMR